MYFNMQQWAQEIIDAKDRRFLPVLYFPCLKLTDYKVIDTVTDAKKMAEVMIATVREYPEIIGAMTGMDLTVDAEAFGAPVRFKKNDVPCLSGTLVETMEDVEKLQVPDPHAARLDVHYDAVRETAKVITDRPIFGGQLGPFSLAANLMPLADALMGVIHTPELMHALLEKATEHLINRALAYKEAGANGVLLAEPTAGLLSPACCDEFSSRYVKRIVDAVQDESFFVILHDCGNVLEMSESMYATGAKGFHYGNSVNMVDICRRMPKDVLVFGNINPAEIFADSPEVLREKCDRQLQETAEFPNFVFSSGCDIPVITSLENIHVMTASLNDHNAKL